MASNLTLSPRRVADQIIPAGEAPEEVEEVTEGAEEVTEGVRSNG